MDLTRRDFLKTAGAAAIGAGFAKLPMVSADEPELSRGLIPRDKGITKEQLLAWRARGEPIVYRGPRRFALGMPAGGICAGQVYATGDGTLGGWHVDGRVNPTGSGVEYRVKPVERELAQGFALAVDGRTAVLADAERGGAYDAIEVTGEYPVMEVRYRASEARDVPPIDVTLRIGSPYCPLDAEASSLPCTVFRFTLRSRAAKPVKGTLSGWLESGVARGSADEHPLGTWSNREAREVSLSAVLMSAGRRVPSIGGGREERVLYTFDAKGAAGYEGWDVTGEAFGKEPARGTLPGQQPVSGFDGKGLVNSFLGGDGPTGRMRSVAFKIDRAYLTFLIGGGGHAGQTCVNLVVDGKVERSATGKNVEQLELRAWDLKQLQGREACIEIVDAATGGWGHVNADRFVLTDALPEQFLGPRPDDLTFGTMAIAFLGRGGLNAGWYPGSSLAGFPPDPDEFLPITREVLAETPLTGLVAAPFDLAPGEAKDLVFVIAWCFPNLHTGHGTRYATRFADALAVVKHVAENQERLLAATDLFRKTYYEDTTLPRWLAARLLMPLANLATGTAQWWKDGRFWGWEGVGCCSGTCAHVWNYAHGEARLFPGLARSTRLMQDLGSAFEEATGRVAFRGERDGGFAYAADGQSGTVLKCLREHLQSADDAFLREAWPRVKKALEFQVAKDGNEDGVLEGAQHNTYDIDFHGANTFVGSLYLAALLAGAAMADRVGDAEAAARWRAIYERGRARTERELWNGEYFVQQIPRGSSTRFQYGEGCLADQLFGQTWARLLGLGAVYDEAKARRALEAVYRYNFAPAIGAYSERFPPGRVYARDREGGLLLCTWPRGGRPDEPVAYRDEVWTGIEYQVAAGMAWEGLVDEALAIVRAVDERYDGLLHNPWNEVECGEHYARAMASWGVYQALCGLHYDGPAGVLGVEPRLRPEDFAAFFPGAEGWGRVVQRRGANEQTNALEVRWGRVRVAEMRLRLPAAARARGDHRVLVAGKEVVALVVADERGVAARLREPVVVEAGESLEVRIRWA